jgi:hypothetical protein
MHPQVPQMAAGLEGLVPNVDAVDTVAEARRRLPPCARARY